MSRDERLAGFYRVHAHIYDATRWAFLFGRDELLDKVTRGAPAGHVVEVGCGTGRNLEILAERMPQTRFTGVDLSGDMLARARRRLRRFGARVRLVEAPYGPELLAAGSVDRVIFSYSLSMMGDARREVLGWAEAHLAPGGLVHAVDFHETPLRVVDGWMRLHGVDISGDSLAALREIFEERELRIRSAGGGAWSWFVLVGAPRG